MIIGTAPTLVEDRKFLGASGLTRYQRYHFACTIEVADGVLFNTVGTIHTDMLLFMGRGFMARASGDSSNIQIEVRQDTAMGSAGANTRIAFHDPSANVGGIIFPESAHNNVSQSATIGVPQNIPYNMRAAGIQFRLASATGVAAPQVVNGYIELWGLDTSGSAESEV